MREVVTSRDEVKRWSEYFESLLNVFDGRVADVGCLQNGRVIASGLVKSGKVLCKTKCGKMAGVDDIIFKFLKKGGDCANN